MDYDQPMHNPNPEYDPAVQGLLTLIATKKELLGGKGRYWRKNKRAEVEAEVQQLELDLQQLQSNSMSVSEDACATSPLSALPSSEPGSPQVASQSFPSTNATHESTMDVVEPNYSDVVPTGNEPDGEHAAASARNTPKDSLPNTDTTIQKGFDDQCVMKTRETDGAGQDNEHIAHSTSEGLLPDTTTDKGFNGAPTIMERYTAMSGQIRVLNAQFDAAEQAGASAMLQAPYQSELTHAFGTPPKRPQQWMDNWAFDTLYVPRNADYDTRTHHMVPHNDGFLGHSVSSMFNDNQPSIHHQPSTLAGDHSADKASSMFDDNQLPIHHQLSTSARDHSADNKGLRLPATTASMQDDSSGQGGPLYAFGGERGIMSHNVDVNMTHVEDKEASNLRTTSSASAGHRSEYVGDFKPPATTAVMQDNSLGKGGRVYTSGGERDGMSHSVDVDMTHVKDEEAPNLRTTASQTSRDTIQASGASRTTKAVSQLTGRPIPTDFDIIGEEQYLVDHSPWASYKDDTVDRQAYLAALEYTHLRHFAHVSNQRPTAFDKKDVFRQADHGMPFEALPERDRLILSARGRVAILAYLDELARTRALAAAADSGSKKKKDPTPKIVPNWVKKLALSDATFLPEAATTSLEVSLEFLTNSDRRTACRYHLSDRFVRGPRDGTPTHKSRLQAGLQDLHGVAYEEAKKHEPFAGHLHCGCGRGQALIDWYLFKTRGAKSTREDEDLKDKVFYQFSTMHPTPRAYHTTLFTALTGLDGFSKALYTGVTGWGLVPGDWKTPKYDFEFNMAVLDHTFKQMNVDPRVLYGPPEPKQPL